MPHKVLVNSTRAQRAGQADPCTCGGRLAKTGPHSFMCRACRQRWRDDHLPPFLTMVDGATDLPPWFTLPD